MSSDFSINILKSFLGNKIEQNKYNVYSKVSNNIFHTILKIKFESITQGIIDIDILVDESTHMNKDKYHGHLLLMTKPFYIQINDNIRKILEHNLRIIMDFLDEVNLLLESNSHHKFTTNEINEILFDVPYMMYNGFYNCDQHNDLKQIIKTKFNTCINNNAIINQRNIDDELFVNILNKINDTSSRQMIQLYVEKIVNILNKYTDDYYINLLKITIDENKLCYFKQFINNDNDNDNDNGDDNDSDIDDDSDDIIHTNMIISNNDSSDDESNDSSDGDNLSDTNSDMKKDN